MQLTRERITEAALVMQAIVESGAGFTGASTIHSYVFAPNAIVKHGTDEQKQRFLPRMATGEVRGAFSMSEPDLGSDVAAIKTSAKLGDDGAYTINTRRCG